jgi:DNA-binding MarR family transcriptional regulator
MPKNPEGFGAWLKHDQPAHAVGFLMKSLHHALRQSMDEALRKRGLELSFAHFAALFGLYCEPGITGAQLARRATVSAQTMNSVLRRLEEEGRIERRPHPDSRRADSWSLTDEGIELLQHAREVGAQVFTRMLAPLAPAEAKALEDYLRRCIAALEGDAPAIDAVDEAASGRAASTARPPRRERKRASRHADAR